MPLHTRSRVQELVLMKANIDRELRPKRIGITWVPRRRNGLSTMSDTEVVITRNSVLVR